MAARLEAGLEARSARRRANDRALAETPPGSRRRLELRCECTCIDCTRSVAIESDELRRLRRRRQRFLLAPEHRCDDVSTVVVRNETYLVVEELPSEVFVG